MHVYFSGIGGTGLGPLALIAHEAGFTVSGSDKQDSAYISYLKKHGVTNIHIGQSFEQIADVHAACAIDWFVYTTAVTSEQAHPPELLFCATNGIKTSTRSDFLTYLLEQKQLAMIGVAGTHGKSTTTAMVIWLMQQLGIPISHSVGAKLSFAAMGHYEPESQYFVYEADEYARNFLAYHPKLSLITGIDWDHPDIYPTRGEYEAAFRTFVEQSATTVAWEADANRAGLPDSVVRLSEQDPLLEVCTLYGTVNRQNAVLVARAIGALTNSDPATLIGHLNSFPGLGRRFEQLLPNLYTDYAHTPAKIRGALETAQETAGTRDVVVVYEGLHNTRQHFIRDELTHLFDDVAHLYIVPSYLAREDPDLALLSPDDLKNMLSPMSQAKTTPSQLTNELWHTIQKHISADDLVLCLSAGGGGSLDEWLRDQITKQSAQ